MGFAPFGIGLLALAVYACYAAGDDDRDQELQIEATPEYGPSAPLPIYLGKGVLHVVR